MSSAYSKYVLSEQKCSQLKSSYLSSFNKGKASSCRSVEVAQKGIENGLFLYSQCLPKSISTTAKESLYYLGLAESQKTKTGGKGKREKE